MGQVEIRVDSETNFAKIRKGSTMKKSNHSFRGIRCGTGSDAYIEATAKPWTPKKGTVIRREFRK